MTAGRFEFYLVENPEDRFSHEEAHIYTGHRLPLDGSKHQWKLL